MPLRLGLTVALLSVVAAFPVGARAANHNVSASGTSFSPANITITQGDTVIWTRGSGEHNVMFTNGPAFDMPPTANDSWTTISRLFDTSFAATTYNYRCELHVGDGMIGTITVNASGGPGPGTPPPGGTPPGGEPPSGPGPGGPGPGGPGPSLPLLKVTLKVSDRTPLAGTRFRLSGVVRPARDRRKVHIQRRGRGGSYKTIATTRLKDGGAAKSEFSLWLRLRGDAVLRARVAGDDERAAGVSKTKSIDVVRPRR
jgi:plastocyanin